MEEISGIKVVIGYGDDAVQSGSKQTERAVNEMVQRLSSLKIRPQFEMSGGGFGHGASDYAVGRRIGMPPEVNDLRARQMEAVRQDREERVIRRKEELIERATRREEREERTARAREHGGHGDLSKRNLLSLRGIENSGLVGTATAAAAIYKGLEMMTVLSEFGSVGPRAEMTRMRMDRIASPVDLINDRNMKGMTEQMAISDTNRKLIQSFESIPVIGQFAQIGDNLTGFSASLEKARVALDRQAEAYVMATEKVAGHELVMASMSGNPYSVHEARMNRSRIMHQKMLDAGADPGTVLQSAIAEQAEISRESQIAAAQYETKLDQLQRQQNMVEPARREMIAARLEGRGEETFRKGRELGEIEIVNQTKAQVDTEKDEAMKLALQRAGAARLQTQRDETQAELLLRRRAARFGEEESGVGAEASRLRQKQKDFEADMFQTERMQDIRRRKMKQAGAYDFEIVAQEQKDREELNEKRWRHERDISNRVTELKSNAASASLRATQQFNRAELLEFDTQSKIRISLIQDAKEKQAAIAADAAARQEIRVRQQRDLGLEFMGLEQRFVNARMIQDRSLPMELQREKGQIGTMGTDYIRQIIAAPQELKWKIKEVAIEELKAQKELMTRIEGGAVGVQLDPTAELIGDPMMITAASRRRQIVKDAINEQIDRIEKVNTNAQDIQNGMGPTNAILGNIQRQLETMHALFCPVIGCV